MNLVAEYRVAHRVLRSMESEPSRLTMGRLMALVCEETDTTLAILTGRFRDRRTSRRRFLFAYLARECGLGSHQAIGRFLNRDRTTVCNQIRRAHDLLNKEDEEFADWVRCIKATIGGSHV